MRLRYNAMPKLSRHGRTHAITPRVCCRLTLAHPALCLHSDAKRSGHAERSGKRGGGSGIFPDYGNAPFVLAEEAKRSG
jgi:hypothetical protein